MNKPQAEGNTKSLLYNSAVKMRHKCNLKSISIMFTQNTQHFSQQGDERAVSQ